MRFIVILVLSFCMAGCSFFMATYEVLEVAYEDEPAAVCDMSTVGVQFEEKTCLKMSDGNFRWR